jgi:hypothetical protein
MSEIAPFPMNSLQYLMDTMQVNFGGFQVGPDPLTEIGEIDVGNLE